MVGMLDERFFMYGEDIDWSFRFHQTAWKITYFAEAGAIHYGGASSAADPARFYIEMQRANLQFWRKYHGRTSTLCYIATVIVHQLVRVLAYGSLYLACGGVFPEFARKARRSLTCLRTSWYLVPRPGPTGSGAVGLSEQDSGEPG